MTEEVDSLTFPKCLSPYHLTDYLLITTWEKASSEESCCHYH